MDAMEAVLRNFKTIPCPSGDACTKPGCQWQHSWDREPQTSSSSSKPAPAASQDEDGPRKRRKLSSEPVPALAPAPVKDEPKPATPHPKSTLEKPVSPPPVKRFTPPKSSPPLKHKVPQPTASAATVIQPTVEKQSVATPSKANGASAVRASPKPSPLPASHGATSNPAVILSNASTVRSSSQRAVLPRVSVASDPNPKTGKAAPSTASKTSSPDVSTPQKATLQTQPQSMNRKPEALNPRHLKTAPAPHDFRYKCLKLLHEQFARLNNELKKDAKDDEKPLILSPQELIWLALDEEERIATEKPAIYNNVIKNRIMHYKKMTVPSWMAERRAALQKQQAVVTPSPARFAAPKAINGPPKEVDTGLTPELEVEFLKFLQTPIDKLAQFGYIPRAPTEEEIKAAIEGEEAANGWEICERCKTRFQVFPGRREEDGALTSGGACTFHPGKAYYPERVPGDSTSHSKRFNCCNTVPGDTPGCSIHQTHVFKTSSPARLAALLPFKETPPNPDAPKDRAVCFDCEMGYTVKGMELLRLTATSWPDGKELLDVLVQPYGEILDLNSRYSGVWPEDIANAVPWEPGQPLPLPTFVGPEAASVPPSEGVGDPKTKQRLRKKLPIVPSPAAARDLLFSLISPDTFLIGHALENDLNAVRIIHPCLIDTALLFPHRRGLPMRYRLKGLMEIHLNKTIQIETPVVDGEGKAVPVEGGHDSAEDARAAGELVRLRVMERWREMKKQGWKVEEGRFVPPAGEGEKKEESEGNEGEVVEDQGVGVGKVVADLAAV